MIDTKSNKPTKKQASLRQAWIKNDMDEFYRAVANLDHSHIHAVFNLIDKNISSIFKGEKFELLKVLINWVYTVNDKTKSRDGLISSFEQKIFFNYSTFQMKNKNIHYLNLCGLLLHSKYIYKLAERFSTENWSEGLTLFTKENLNKMPETIKLKYLKHSFCSITPEFLIEIENLFDAKKINQYITDIQNQTPTQFWLSEFNRKTIFTDEQKVFLLKFSEKYGHTISEKTKNNLLPFINKHSPLTIYYIIEKTSCEFIKREIYPHIEIQQSTMGKINPSFNDNFLFLKQCVLEYQLGEKPTNNVIKKVKI